MNIGLLSFEYPPETGFGGIGTYTWYHARALARLGHQVHVLAGSTVETSLSTREHDGVYVHRYRDGGMAMRLFGRLGDWGCHWTRQRLENAWCMYWALNILQHRVKLDVLEVPECGAEGSLITTLVDIPTVVRFHSPSKLIMPFYDVPRADHVLCSWVETPAIRRATALTSCSAFLAGQVRKQMGVEKPIRVLPNGIDLALFDQEAALDAAVERPRRKTTIFFAGRMERRKGIQLCGAIAEKILRRHDVSFVFAGEDLFGYMTNTLLPSLDGQQLRGSVHYLGKLDLQQVRAQMRSADIFLLTSLWENCPYSCLEAMAAGRPIVSSDQGGMPGMIQHGYNGLLARTGDPESFAQQIEMLIEDQALRWRLGAAARQTVERTYTDQRVARLAIAIYEEALYGAPRLKKDLRPVSEVESGVFQPAPREKALLP